MSMGEFLKEPDKLSIDDKLALVNFKVDEEAHIKVDTVICRTCREKPCLHVCPAENYNLLENGELVFSWEGCLECGTCRIACQKGAIDWSYPRGGFGVRYRYG